MGRSPTARNLFVSAFTFALAWVVPAHSADPDPTREQQALELFTERCGGDAYEAKVEARFAPVRRLDAEHAEAGKWKYEHTTEDKQYHGGRYPLSGDSDSVDFVSTIFAEPNQTRPHYIWHVISVPEHAPHRRMRSSIAYAALYDRFHEDHELWSQTAFQKLESSSVRVPGGKRNLVYLKDDLARHDRREVRKAWELAFPQAMENLVLPSQSIGGVYSHTFYYHNVMDQRVQINPHGDRRNSNRSVREPGTALGFVLDPAGACLQAASLEIVIPGP